MAEKELVAPNVASVPQYSPFRYPGGKSRLYPFIVRWLRSKPSKPEILIEPFAGGAHVGLTAAIEDLTNRVLLVEIDEDIADVWRTVLSEDCEWLADQIMTFEMGEETAEYILECGNNSTRERAFKAILQNRISRGGITAPGSGRLDYGENGKGLHSRWYPNTLKQRITNIFTVRDKIAFVEGDGLTVMRQNEHLQDVVFFIDPPYPTAGRRLYRYSDIKPGEVFEVVSSLDGDFLITYDDSHEILQLVR
jgi:DNA adenine methylase